MAKSIFFILLGLMVVLPSNLSTAAEVIVGAQVPAAQQISIDRVDHALWGALLRKYCDAQGNVNYQAWQKSADAQQQLNQYLSQLSLANPSLTASRSNQLAFWVNAYNAVTIKGILREYPTTSIKNHQSLTFGYKIWDDLKLVVGNRKYSLNNIEHDVLRKMGEPRIHFAIVCASIGCPPLLNQAYTAENLDIQLTKNAKRFFADPAKFMATSRGELKLSKILKWFGNDFGPTPAAQLRAIAPYLPTSAAQSLATSGRARVSYLDYNWNLNDQATRSK